MTIHNTSAIHRLRRRRLKRTLSMAMAFLFIYIAGYFGYALADSAMFDIAEITVSGNPTVAREEIIALSGARIGANMLRVSKERARENILAQPYIKDATVSRVFPNKIVIAVTERKPAALLSVNERFLLLDDSGFCLAEISEVVAAANWALPVVLGGPHMGTIQPGEPAEDKGIQAALVLIQKLDPFFMENIQLFEAPSAERLSVINRDGLRVFFGQPEDLDRKLQNYEDLLIKNAERCNVDTLHYVDLRYDTQITLSWK